MTGRFEIKPSDDSGAQDPHVEIQRFGLVGTDRTSSRVAAAGGAVYRQCTYTAGAPARMSPPTLASVPHANKIIIIIIIIVK